MYEKWYFFVFFFCISFFIKVLSTIHMFIVHMFVGVCVCVMEKAMAPHSSTLAWKIPWTEEPVRLQSMGSLESDTTEQLHFHFSLSCIGEGNGNPLQCSCLENPRDGGAWWASVYGAAQSRTRLKRRSGSGVCVKCQIFIHLLCFWVSWLLSCSSSLCMLDMKEILSWICIIFNLYTYACTFTYMCVK